MKKIFSILVVLSIILGTVNVYAADEIISWFGNSENNWTEGFEEYGVYAPTDIFEGTVVAANNPARLITGEKYLEAEPSRSLGYADMTQKAIKEGIADISFAMRIRSAADASISFTETGTVITGEGHVGDNVFQVRTNGANVDLYINNEKKAQLTSKSTQDSNKMSNIIKIHAVYDFFEHILRIKADVYDSGQSIIETKTMDFILDAGVESVAGMHITSRANYSGLAIDDLRVEGFAEGNIDDIIPSNPQSTAEPGKTIYASDNFDSLPQQAGEYIVQMPGYTSAADSETNNDSSITFYAKARSNGSGDNKTGIKVQADGSDKFVTGVSGNFANGGRHAYMTFNNVPSFADMGQQALSVEFDIKMTTVSADISFNDGANKAFAFKISDNMLAVSNGSTWVQIPGTVKDEWYGVKIIPERHRKTDIM